MEFPKIRDQQDIMHIDGTPNGGYALRILRAYRARCREKWEVKGLNPNTTALYDLMNKHQDQRAVELDAAIKVLEELITVEQSVKRS